MKRISHSVEPDSLKRETEGIERGKTGQGARGFVRRMPVGAELVSGGGSSFRVWAPGNKSVAVQICSGPEFVGRATQTINLKAEAHGYFSGYATDVRPGTLYKYRLKRGSFPDPASRFQPEGVHGPSQVVDPAQFQWTDKGWKGVSRERQVIYELHVGTFTREGTWFAASRHLPRLADLGVTVIELMPVAEFPGRFGWGYDGVDLFAPTRLYGTPDDFRAFVNKAHNLGLGVILDVVYNHLGPDGNYLREFSAYYFSDRYKNEWGEAINFDDENSGPVRELFLSNAAYWIEEFHLDGLRLDATQQMFDSSPIHILKALSQQLREIAGKRSLYLVGENECQHAKLLRAAENGGYDLDALWNDDFHHSAMVALRGRGEAYYSDYKGRPQEFISALKYGFLYQGQWYRWQQKHRGTPALEIHPCQFIVFIQNHDQVANSLRGLRVHQLTSPGRFRAMTALLLLGPATPMLFQGQEFGASTPFRYFADHKPELARLVAKGRKEFLRQFPTISSPESELYLAEPDSEESFWQSKLDHSELDQHPETYSLHCDLLKLRRQDPVFSRNCTGRLDGAVLGPEAFVLRFFGENQEDRLLLINFGLDLELSPAPEPLLAPVEGKEWAIRWSSEDPRYGGSGTPPLDTKDDWHMLGHAAVVLTPVQLTHKQVRERNTA